MLPDLPIEFYELTSDITTLLDRSNYLRSEITSMNSLIEDMNIDISGRYKDDMCENAKVEQELNILRAELAALTVSENKEAPRPDPNPASNIVIRMAVPEKQKKQCIKYYNKIAMRCHPDRTKNIKLHEIFYEAGLAKDNYDLRRLTDLWYIAKQIRKGFDMDFEPTLHDKLDTLKQEKSDLQQGNQHMTDQVAQIDQSEGYQLAKLYDVTVNDLQKVPFFELFVRQLNTQKASFISEIAKVKLKILLIKNPEMAVIIKDAGLEL